MYLDTVPVAPSRFSDGVRDSDGCVDAPGAFAVQTSGRVRGAVTVPKILPLTPADWAELRATVSAMRPSSPPRIFSRAGLSFAR